jgi:hypothetical protein
MAGGFSGRGVVGRGVGLVAEGEGFDPFCGKRSISADNASVSPWMAFSIFEWV